MCLEISAEYTTLLVATFILCHQTFAIRSWPKTFQFLIKYSIKRHNQVLFAVTDKKSWQCYWLKLYLDRLSCCTRIVSSSIGFSWMGHDCQVSVHLKFHTNWRKKNFKENQRLPANQFLTFTNELIIWAHVLHLHGTHWLSGKYYICLP